MEASNAQVHLAAVSPPPGSESAQPLQGPPSDSPTVSRATAAQPTATEAAPPILRLPEEVRWKILSLLDDSDIAFSMIFTRSKSPQLSSPATTPISQSCSQLYHATKFFDEAEIGRKPFYFAWLSDSLRKFQDMTLTFQRLPGPSTCPNGLQQLRSITVNFDPSERHREGHPPRIRFVFDSSTVDESLLSTFHFAFEDGERGQCGVPARGQIEAYDRAVAVVKEFDWSGAMQYYPLWYHTRRYFERPMKMSADELLRGRNSHALSRLSPAELFLVERFGSRQV